MVNTNDIAEKGAILTQRLLKEQLSVETRLVKLRSKGSKIRYDLKVINTPSPFKSWIGQNIEVKAHESKKSSAWRLIRPTNFRQIINFARGDGFLAQVAVKDELVYIWPLSDIINSSYRDELISKAVQFNELVKKAAGGGAGLLQIDFNCSRVKEKRAFILSGNDGRQKQL